MEKICQENECCGCGICSNICPQNAISMEYNKKGFFEPIINKELCIDCGLCQNKCPIINNIPKIEPIKIYACKNKNEQKRETSSSGGFFQEISELILNQSGSVFGVSFDDEFNVIHEKVDNIKDLEKIKKSKYVQSNTKNIFNQVKEELNLNRKVLFSGTPCQIQALKNMKNKNEDKLYLIDLVCHGVPSPGIFDEYKKILENKYNSKITNINFRYKKFEETQNIKIDFENGESYVSSYRLGDMYYRLFLKDLVLRECCYDCKFRSFERISDISLADFWGIEKGSAKEFADKKGISLVLINTEKGLELFNSVKDKLEYYEVSKEDCEPYNSFRSINNPEEISNIWQDIEQKGIEFAVKNNNVI